MKTQRANKIFISKKIKENINLTETDYSTQDSSGNFNVEIPTIESYDLCEFSDLEEEVLVDDDIAVVLDSSQSIPTQQTQQIQNSLQSVLVNQNTEIFFLHNSLVKFLLSKKNNNFPLIDLNDFNIFKEYLAYSIEDYNEENELIFPNFLHMSTVSFKKFYPGQWFNDEIVNSYFELITREKFIINSHDYNFFIFNTFFFEQLNNNCNYQKLLKFINKKNTHSFSPNYSFYYIPVHLNNHWSLIKINAAKRTMHCYDSLLVNIEIVRKCCQSLVNFFDYLLDSKKSDWLVELVNVPQQNNLSDCGVFMCKFLDYLINYKTIDFTSEDILYFRVLIGLEIIKGKLLYSL